MKKRAIFGVGVASLTVGLLSAGGAFASSLDYAMSVGQVEMGDTGNYVIEATSDGGYVVGGQAVHCFKEVDDLPIPNTLSMEPDDGYIQNEVFGEVAPMEECEEYYSQPSNLAQPSSYQGRTKVDSPIMRTTGVMKLNDMPADEESLFDQYCSYDFSPYRGWSGQNGDIFGFLSSTRLMDYVPSVYYQYYCVDYIAKFKQDGTKEWLTTIRNGDMPVAVGETTNDYRLITNYGMLYSFAKANGEEGLDKALPTQPIMDAIINYDGTTTVVADYTSVALLNPNGSLNKVLESADANEEYVVIPIEIAKPLVRSKNGFIAMHIVEHSDESGDYYTEEIVEVSTDLNTITPIMELDRDDMESLLLLVPVSADEEGDVMLVAIPKAEKRARVDTRPLAMSVDKNGNPIESIDLYELLGTDMSTSPSSEADIPRILDDFTVVRPAQREMVRLSPQLTKIDGYTLADGESINDVVVLKDGSMAGVGRSTTSTANYTVDGNMNGTYLRFAAKKNGSGTTNPQTDDEDIKIYIASGAAVILFALGLVLRGSKRRAN